MAMVVASPSWAPARLGNQLDLDNKMGKSQRSTIRSAPRGVGVIMSLVEIQVLGYGESGEQG